MTGALALHALTVGMAHTETTILRWLDHVDATEVAEAHTAKGSTRHDLPQDVSNQDRAAARGPLTVRRA